MWRARLAAARPARVGAGAGAPRPSGPSRLRCAKVYPWRRLPESRHDDYMCRRARRSSCTVQLVVGTAMDKMNGSHSKLCVYHMTSRARQVGTPVLCLSV